MTNRNIKAILPVILVLLLTISAAIQIDAGRYYSDASTVTTDLYAQEIHKPDNKANQDTSKQTEQSTVLYQVMGVVLFIWIGLAFFLFRLDRRVAKLEKQVKLDK
jgi:CcmD family protein